MSSGTWQWSHFFFAFALFTFMFAGAMMLIATFVHFLPKPHMPSLLCGFMVAATTILITGIYFMERWLK